MKRLCLPVLLLVAAPVLSAAALGATPARPTPRPDPAKAAAQPADPVAALLEQSRDAQARGETELALRLAQAAIVADPVRTAPYVALGDLYAAAGQSEYARSFYDAALQIDPVDAGATRAIAALGGGAATAANRP